MFTAFQARKNMLEGAADFWATSLQLATIAVVIGVALEVAATVLEVRENWKNGEKIRVYHWLTFLGSAVIVIGVAWEFWAELKGATAETFLRVSNELEQAKTQSDATSATMDATFAIEKEGGLDKYIHDKTSEIDRDIARLENAEKRAKAALAADEKARQAMVDQLKQRDLTKAQMKIIADAIRGKVKTVYLYPSDDPDSSTYVFSIGAVMKQAGVTVLLMLDTSSNPPRFWKEFPMPGTGAGITIYAPTGAKNSEASAIADAFEKVGIFPIVEGNDPAVPGIPFPAVFIGAKPVPFGGMPGFATTPKMEKFFKKHPPPWDPK